MKKIICLLVITCIFASCKKEEDKIFTVKGVLLKDCGGQPLAGRALLLVQKGGSGFSYGKQALASDTTDANGNFEFNYKSDNNAEPVSIETSDYFAFMEKIPERKSLENVVVYQSPRANLKVMLNVTNPYTANDTLYFFDLRINKGSFIRGPFISGELYTAPNQSLLIMNYPTTSTYITWAINNRGSGVPQAAFFNISKYCTDTTTTTIDIK